MPKYIIQAYNETWADIDPSTVNHTKDFLETAKHAASRYLYLNIPGVSKTRIICNGEVFFDLEQTELFDQVNEWIDKFAKSDDELEFDVPTPKTVERTKEIAQKFRELGILTWVVPGMNADLVFHWLRNGKDHSLTIDSSDESIRFVQFSNLKLCANENIAWNDETRLNEVIKGTQNG